MTSMILAAAAAAAFSFGEVKVDCEERDGWKLAFAREVAPDGARKFSEVQDGVYDFVNAERAMEAVCDICADVGIGLTLETGQETAEDLAEMLANLPGVYVNFDPANMILYGKGDPVKAVKTLAPWIRHIHIKDANYTKIPGTWGEEVEWTKGEVNADAFIAALKEIGYDGCLAVEREAGNDSPGDIARAVMDLHERGF